MRLSDLSQILSGVSRPGYNPAAHGVGIVHLGLGAFHKAHQAVYTDDALSEAGGDWRIAGVSLRGADAAAALTPQNGLYTVIERGAGGPDPRVVGSIAQAIAEIRTPGATLKMMTDPAVKIVSLTITEKGYGIDRTSGGVEPDHPGIAADLATPHTPSGAVGLIVEALRGRWEDGVPPFAVLCCDNLPHNGAFLRGGVLDFSRRANPDLADWIADMVPFPSTMVDRITPAPTDATRADAARFLGCEDLAAVETEPFTQWVIEGFSGPRPEWEAGGAIFVPDVAPFEKMKLRMLNGAHSMIAYAGFLNGKRYVRDVMADAGLTGLVRRHLQSAAAALEPLPGIDYADYADALVARFANPSIAHETYQIAMDGTEKLPQRILEPAQEALTRGGDIGPFAFAVACWMRYCLGRKDTGETYPLRDPRELEIAAAIRDSRTASDICLALHSLPRLFPERLRDDPIWRSCVCGHLERMLATFRHGP